MSGQSELTVIDSKFIKNKAEQSNSVGFLLQPKIASFKNVEFIKN